MTNPDISSGAYAFNRAMWTGMMLGAHAAMSAAERAELESWERSHVTGDGEVATSDWPGWSRYLPPRPEPPKRRTTPKKPIPNRLRRAVLERDAYRCRHCGTHIDLCVDHIYPESKGGPAELWNLQTLCRRCNTRKGTRVRLRTVQGG